MSLYPLNPTPTTVRNLEAYIAHAEAAAVTAQGAAQGIADQVAIATTQAGNAQASAQAAAASAATLTTSVNAAVNTGLANIKAVRVDVAQNFLDIEARVARSNIRSLGWASKYLSTENATLTSDDVGKAVYTDGASSITLFSDTQSTQGDTFDIFVNTGSLTVNNNPASINQIFLPGTAGNTIVLAPGQYRIRSEMGAWRVASYSRPQESYPSIGDIVMTFNRNAPPGTLKLNGALVSRTTYAQLWQFAQDQSLVTNESSWLSGVWIGAFSSGDGSTNFRLPDFRGRFLRFFDDGSGVDNGRQLGTFQDQAIPDHRHETPVGSDGTNSYFWQSTFPQRLVGGTTRSRVSTINEANANTQVSSTGQISAFLSTDNYPRNVTAIACIRYK